MVLHEWLEQYRTNGFFVMPGLFEPQAVMEMQEECSSILAGEYGRLYAGAIEPDRNVPDQMRKVTAVVERSEVFRRCVRNDRLIGVLTHILGGDILLLRDIIMLKPPQSGSMAWHQDSTQWPVDPPDLCTVWVAMESAWKENGCVRVVPGSHRRGLIYSRSGGLLLQDDEVDPREVHYLPAEPGDAIFMNSCLVHGSGPNHSERSRRALVMSFMRAATLLTRSDVRSRYLLVAGRTHPGFVQSNRS